MAYTLDSHNSLCVAVNIAKTTEIPNVVLGQQKLTEIGQHVLLYAEEGFLDARRVRKTSSFPAEFSSFMKLIHHNLGTKAFGSCTRANVC